MGELVWTNKSSFTVNWFVITRRGSASDALKSGAEYRLDNADGITQVGIQCMEGPIYVVHDMTREPDVDVHLLASDIIPSAADADAVPAAKPSIRYIRFGPLAIEPGAELPCERHIEKNEACVIGVGAWEESQIRKGFLVEVRQIRYVLDGDLSTPKVRFVLHNLLDQQALVNVHIMAIRA